MAWRRKKEARANVSSGQYPKERDKEKEKEKLCLKGRQTQQVIMACADCEVCLHGKIRMGV